MDVTEAIQADRATRDFADEHVPKDVITDLVDSARWAGSGHNRQPWVFVALQNRDRLTALADHGEYTTPLRRAPAGIVLAVERATDDAVRRNTTFDAGRAAQNLMLAATAKGIGTVPQGFRNTERVGEFLGLPQRYRVLIGFAVGYPAYTPDERIEGVEKRDELAQLGRRPVSDLLHWGIFE
jgi:nitroreductase